MKLGIPAGVDAPLAKRLAALIFFRLVVLAIFLATIELYYFKDTASGGVSTKVALAAVALAFTASAAYGLLLRRGRGLTWVAHAQLVTDQLTWTAIVYITGGVTSGSASLYGLTCLSGAILLGTSGALTAAFAGIAGYLSLCLAFAYEWLLPPADQAAEAYALRSSDMVYPAFSTVMAITVVTLLAAYLSERLRAFGGRLEAVTRRAEEAEKLAALGRLAAGLAHEIRNPLGSIRGSIELLRTGGGLDPEAARLCELVEREAGRLNDLVTDMVDLSRPRHPDKRPLDLARTARDVVELAHRSGRGQDVRVHFEGPDRLDCRADGGQLHQVLWNLVRNAIQASSAGAEVRVALRRNEGGAVLEVSDDGPGIPSDAREHIFDAFYSTRAHGVGIGLAVVKQVIDAHHFTLEVDSSENSGTTIRIIVPAAALIDLPDETRKLEALAAVGIVLAIAAGHGCSSPRDWTDPSSPVPELDGPLWWADPPPTASAVASAEALPPPSAESPTPPSSSGEPLEVVLREGLYRNTYYDFPADDAANAGERRQLFDGACTAITLVSAIFHDQLCVQGSGRLTSGETVSFAKRDCACAATCPRTNQKICYEKLDPKKFPHGRGAMGTAITPLRSVAVDSEVITLGTVLYLPDYQGLRDTSGNAHDGCFLAEDRGSRVKGRHVDIFTGDPKQTESWNKAVPSNQGVRVIVEAGRCAYLRRNKG